MIQGGEGGVNEGVTCAMVDKCAMLQLFSSPSSDKTLVLQRFKISEKYDISCVNELTAQISKMGSKYQPTAEFNLNIL